MQENASPLAGYGVVEFDVKEAEASNPHQRGQRPAAPTRAAGIVNRDGHPDDSVNRDWFPMNQMVSNDSQEQGPQGRITWTLSGEVVVDAEDPEYLGARAHTNNTGELSALYWALHRASQRRRGSGRDTIWSDSLYALNMTKGVWMPRSPRNREFVSKLRGLWRRVQRERPGEVVLRHVRSHTRVPGNELADWLADAGTVPGQGGPDTSPTSAAAWLRSTLAQPDTQARAAAQRPTQARATAQQPTQARTTVQQPTQARATALQPTQARATAQQPTQARTTVQQPTQPAARAAASRGPGGIGDRVGIG